MPKKPYQQAIGRQGRQQKEARQLLVRTRAYRTYDQQRRAAVAAEINEAGLGGIGGGGLGLGLLELLSNPEERLIQEFCATLEGQKIAARLGLSPFFMAIPDGVAALFGDVVIPYRPADISETGRGLLNYSPHLWPGNYLVLRLPLERGRHYLLNLVEKIIRFYIWHVQLSAPTPGAKSTPAEQLPIKYRAYDMVEEFLVRGKNHHQAILQATQVVYKKHLLSA